MRTRSRTSGSATKLALVSGLCLLLLGLIVRHSLVAYLAGSDPGLALRINPTSPAALVALAELTLRPIELQAAEASDPGVDDGSRLPAFAAPAILTSIEGAPNPATSRQAATAAAATALDRPAALAKARDLAERALRHEPINYRALTALGKTYALSSVPAERAQAHAYFDLAARQSHRASDAIYWLFRDSLVRKDYRTALRHADTLLRTVSAAAPIVLPVLSRLLEVPEASPHVKELVASDPPWRQQFMATLPTSITDARTPLSLLLALKETSHPPTATELKTYLDALVRQGFHQLAYYAWLQFLPPDQLATTGFLFNGDFAADPSGYPFDWIIRAGTGMTAGIATSPVKSQKRALRLDFANGRIEFPGVSQIVFLPAGQFVLSGGHQGDLAGKRGLRWRIYCLKPAPALLAETPMHMGLISPHREFQLEFTVPAEKCEAQQLRLELDARSASEQLVEGTIFYDNLRIERASSGSASPEAGAPSRR